MHWNSTFLLLVCALHLKDELTRWVATYSKDDNAISELRLSQQEWTHVRYLVVLLKPYYMWTEAFSKSTELTITMTWMAYNNNFYYLETYDTLL
jgi:hypothetical protein